MPKNPYNLKPETLKGSLPEAIGDVIFVDSSDGNVNGDGSSLRPFSTIEAAMNKSGLSSGDKIIVMPGHTETVSAAGDITCDVAGVEVIGLGVGTQIPTITLDTATTATISVSANDVKFKNVAVSANFADIVSLFTLTTAKNFTLDSCELKATAADKNATYVIDTNTTDNAVDGLTIVNCSWIEPDTATVSMVKGDADIDSMTIEGCYVNLGVNTNDKPALVDMATGKDVTNVRLAANEVIRLNDANPLLLVTDTTTANTGIVAKNFVRHADTAGELLVTASTKIGFIENYATAADDASGYLLPAADS